MSDLKTLAWRNATATQPPPNVRVLVLNDSGDIGLGCYTTSNWWHTDFSGSIITHWCPLEAVSRPAPEKPAPIAPPETDAPTPSAPES